MLKVEKNDQGWYIIQQKMELTFPMLWAAFKGRLFKGRDAVVFDIKLKPSDTEQAPGEGQARREIKVDYMWLRFEALEKDEAV